MDPSSLQQHHQEIMESQSLDSMLLCTKPQQSQGQQEKKPRPTDEAVKCPRCDSSNTKFCYYNNYSLSQPRYFCKSCRRYWTKGGTLRNVPVGGGCRKNNKRSSSSSSSSRMSSTPDHHQLITTIPTSSPFDHHHDLTLTFSRLQKQVGGSMGFDHHENHGNISLPIGNTHFDLFGNSFLDPQHVYYGGDNSVNQDHIHHDDGHQQMGMQFDHQINQEMLSNASTPTTIKQELSENRVLWGLPWQINSGEGNYMNAPSWHSLLNSPLM